MSIYRLKVAFTDNPEVYRLIDIKLDDNLEKLHKAILKSIKFQEGELAAFYINYKDPKKKIEIGLADMNPEAAGGLLMKNVKIKEYISKPEDTITYVYDFLNMWTFDVSLIKTLEKPVTGTKYPAIIKSVGEAPSQFEDENDILLEDFSDEDLAILDEMMSKNKKSFSKKSDAEDDEFGGFNEEFSDDIDFDEDIFRDEDYYGGGGGRKGKGGYRDDYYDNDDW